MNCRVYTGHELSGDIPLIVTNRGNRIQFNHPISAVFNGFGRRFGTYRDFEEIAGWDETE